MIPGTLRPLPKRVKELKEKSDVFLPRVKMAQETTEDIYTNSKSYGFEQIKTHYNQLNRYYTDILPLVSESDKLVNKYINDELLNEFVFNLHTQLVKARDQLQQDIQRLETMLMSRRKSYIEKRIPFIKEQITNKLSFLKKLSFEEIIKHGEEYSKMISEIQSNIWELRDEYTKLLEGSFDVSSFYEYLEEELSELELEIQEYEFILLTCKMELYANTGAKLIEEGKEIDEKFAQERTKELLKEAQNFIERSLATLEDMSELKVSKPKKGFTKDFLEQFDKLKVRFNNIKNDLEDITSTLITKAENLETYIDQIDGLQQIKEKGEVDLSEATKLLRIKRVGVFKALLKEGQLPHLKLTEERTLMITAEELTPEIIDQLTEKLAAINEEKYFTNLKAHLKTLEPKRILGNIKSGLKNFSGKISDTTKKVIGSTKQQAQKLSRKQKEGSTTKEGEDREE